MKVTAAKSQAYTGHCFFVQVKPESRSFTRLDQNLMSSLSGVDPEKSDSFLVSEHVRSSSFIFGNIFLVAR